MDRHTCKLCPRRFSNGRALGGHMRSHVASGTTMAAAANTKPHLHDLSPSPSSSSSASHGEQDAPHQAAAAAEAEVAEAAEGGEAKQLAYYGLRENPRKSYRLVDPEFSSTFPAGECAAGVGSSVVLQDGESETESSKPPPLGRRSARRRRRSSPQLPPPPPNPELSPFDPEPVSSVSDTTPEEDVARCLMMLSRDAWTASKRRKTHDSDVAGDEQDDAEEEEQQQQLLDGGYEEEERAGAARSRKGGRRRYQCGTCGKVFRSYQALGGHRASHKNSRACAGPAAASRAPAHAHAHVGVVFEGEGEEYERRHGCHSHLDADSEANAFPSSRTVDRRPAHECPVCFRVFGSGQALGGHKRSHLAYGSASTNPSLLLSSSSNAAAAASDVAAAVTTAVGSVGGGGGVSSPVGMSSTKKCGMESLIDLNLPAPMDEEVEMSAVFDGEL